MTRRLKFWNTLAVSLTVVILQTTLVGLGFLPKEFRQLTRQLPISVLEFHQLANDPRAVVLCHWQSADDDGRFLWEIALLNSLESEWRLDQSRRVLVPATTDSLAAMVNSDGSVLYVARGAGNVQSFDLTTENPKPQHLGAYAGGGLFDIACSAGGDIVVAGGDGGLCAWNTADRQICWTRDELKHIPWMIDPTSNHIVAETRAGELIELNVFTGMTQRVITCFESPALRLALSPNGDAIARIGVGGALALLDQSSGEPLWPEALDTQEDRLAARIMTFSPCGRVLITGHVSDPSRLLVWRVESGQHIGTLSYHTASISGGVTALPR